MRIQCCYLHYYYMDWARTSLLLYELAFHFCWDWYSTWETNLKHCSMKRYWQSSVRILNHYDSCRYKCYDALIWIAQVKGCETQFIRKYVSENDHGLWNRVMLSTRRLSWYMCLDICCGACKYNASLLTRMSIVHMHLLRCYYCHVKCNGHQCHG